MRTASWMRFRSTSARAACGADLAERELCGECPCTFLQAYDLGACLRESVEDFGLGAVTLGWPGLLSASAFSIGSLASGDSRSASRRAGFFTSRPGSSGSVS